MKVSSYDDQFKSFAKRLTEMDDELNKVRENFNQRLLKYHEDSENMGFEIKQVQE